MKEKIVYVFASKRHELIKTVVVKKHLGLYTLKGIAGTYEGDELFKSEEEAKASFKLIDLSK